MSVYTSISVTQLETIIRSYQLGTLLSCRGIAAGIENTNYLLNTVRGDFILTLYEHFSTEELLPYLSLLAYLGKFESYFPSPIVNATRCYAQIIAGKPVAIFNCLPGQSVFQANISQCQSVAKALSRLHLMGTVPEFHKENSRSLNWLQETAQKLRSDLSVLDAALLDDELDYQRQQNLQHLPRGIIHADLFKDNVLFVGNKLSAMLDFYAACQDCFLLDIAITLNDWCVNDQGLYSPQLQEFFLQAYQQQRRLAFDEVKYLPVLLRRASLRFWLSRLEHKLNPMPGEITQQKDPDHFKRLLLQHKCEDTCLIQ